MTKSQNYLIKWWFDFGNNDLFSIPESHARKEKVLLDANIIFKLKESPSNDYSGAKYLMADWLVDQVDYYYAPEIFNEISRDQDTKRANKSRQFVKTKFYKAKFKDEKSKEIYKELQELISGDSSNIVSDRLQLAECIASEIPYFITVDSGILKIREKLFEKYGLQVFRPPDFIRTVDQKNNAVNYHATRIAGVNFEYQELKTEEIDSLVNKFLDKESGEKKHYLKDKLTSIAGDISNSIIKTVQDKDGNKLGFWAANVKKEALEITLIRTIRKQFSNTLFNQLVFDAVKKALELSKYLVRINEPGLKLPDKELLESFGFVQSEEIWSKVTLPFTGNSNSLIENTPVISKVFCEESLKNKITQQQENPNPVKFEIERFFWPVKFTDLEIPVYIIPIKPYWASQLFDYYAAESSLFGADPHLVWNRENIYYRSPTPLSEQSPARILWYVSSSNNRQNTNRTKGIVACSYLDDVQTGEAKHIFKKFKHYGVYGWKNVLKQAKNDPYKKVKVLKFSDTEVFRSIIPYHSIQTILQKNGFRENKFQAPRQVNKKVFFDLYQFKG